MGRDAVIKKGGRCVVQLAGGVLRAPIPCITAKVKWLLLALVGESKSKNHAMDSSRGKRPTPEGSRDWQEPVKSRLHAHAYADIAKASPNADRSAETLHILHYETTSDLQSFARFLVSIFVLRRSQTRPLGYPPFDAPAANPIGNFVMAALWIGCITRGSCELHPRPRIWSLSP